MCYLYGIQTKNAPAWVGRLQKTRNMSLKCQQSLSWHHEQIVNAQDDLSITSAGIVSIAYARIESKFLQTQLAHYPIYPKQGEF